jgi:hypothetical protein
MATLNVKHLPDALYRKLKARAKREHARSRRKSWSCWSRRSNRPPLCPSSSCAD